jgi:hypothetical protein
VNKVFRCRSAIFFVALAAILLAALTACSSAATSSAPPTTSTPTTTAAGPSIKITSPAGNVFHIGDVLVNVQVTNFTLVDKLGKANAPGEGHIHYFLDVDAPTAQGAPAVTGPGTYAAIPGTSYTWHNVGGGSHKFSVELANNDLTPLNPPVVATLQVLVIPEIGPASLVILTPRDGSIVVGTDVTIMAQVANYNLAGKLGGANAGREGHLHYFMDVAAPTVVGQPAFTAPGTYADTADNSYTWKNVTPGSHTFSLELVNNDHTPLDPAVTTKITITVSAR